MGIVMQKWPRTTRLGASHRPQRSRVSRRTGFLYGATSGQVMFGVHSIELDDCPYRWSWISGGRVVVAEVAEAYELDWDGKKGSIRSFNLQEGGSRDDLFRTGGSPERRLNPLSYTRFRTFGVLFHLWSDFIASYNSGLFVGWRVSISHFEGEKWADDIMQIR